MGLCLSLRRMVLPSEALAVFLRLNTRYAPTPAAASANVLSLPMSHLSIHSGLHRRFVCLARRLLGRLALRAALLDLLSPNARLLRRLADALRRLLDARQRGLGLQALLPFQGRLASRNRADKPTDWAAHGGISSPVRPPRGRPLHGRFPS